MNSGEMMISTSPTTKPFVLTYSLMFSHKVFCSQKFRIYQFINASPSSTRHLISNRKQIIRAQNSHQKIDIMWRYIEQISEQALDQECEISQQKSWKTRKMLVIFLLGQSNMGNSQIMRNKTKHIFYFKLRHIELAIRYRECNNGIQSHIAQKGLFHTSIYNKRISLCSQENFNSLLKA